MAKTLTATGLAQVNTTTKKFGSGSCSLLGTGQPTRVTVTNYGTDFNLGTGDFTIEFFYYPTDNSTNGGLFTRTNFNGEEGWAISSYHDGSQPGAYFIWAEVGGSGWANAGSVAAISLNNWHHIAWVRSGSSFYGYVDGTRYSLRTSSAAIKEDSEGLDPFWGTQLNGDYNTLGYQDEIRFSNVARYTAATITVPTAAFTYDANTKLLVHCDGTNGSTVFTDDDGTTATSIKSVNGLAKASVKSFNGLANASIKSINGLA
jgi:hypothetical protein